MWPIHAQSCDSCINVPLSFNHFYHDSWSGKWLCGFYMNSRLSPHKNVVWQFKDILPKRPGTMSANFGSNCNWPTKSLYKQALPYIYNTYINNVHKLILSRNSATYASRQQKQACHQHY